ncbi:MAG: nucleoside hydrolase [Oscillospiraceae bacterium]
MKNVIVDIASDGLKELIEQLKNKDLNIMGVCLSCDVANGDELCRLNAWEIQQNSNVKVYKGAQRPMLNADYVMGRVFKGNGCEGKFEGLHAVNFIIEAAKTIDELEIICLGPLTNVALAILKDDSAMKNIKRIYVSGGALLGYQSTTPVAQHNILADVEAADIVFRSGIAITLIPENVCECLPKATFEVAVGAPTQSWDAFVNVDTGVSLTRGQTVIDLVGRNPIDGKVTHGIKQTVITKVEG